MPSFTSTPDDPQSAEMRAFIAAKRGASYSPQDTVQQLRDATEAVAANGQVLPTTTVQAVTIGGHPCEWLIDQSAVDASRTYVFFHGGAYFRGSIASSRAAAAWISRTGRARVLSAHYRLAPEHRFPAAVDDALAVYRGVLETGVDPAHIAMGGISAGGGLCLALLLTARDAGLPLPAAVTLMSAWTDLTQSAHSYTRKAAEDPIISKVYLDRFAAEYLGGAAADNPLASPLFGALEGLPPMLMHVGSLETMQDDTLLFAEKAQRAGVQVQVRVWEGAIHGWHGQPNTLPEARAALQELGEYVRTHCAP